MKLVFYCCLNCKTDGYVGFEKLDEDVDARFCPNCGEPTFDDGLYDVTLDDFIAKYKGKQ